MQEPILTRITRDLVETLEEVRVEAGRALDVEPRRRKGHRPRDLLVIVSQGSPERVDDPAVEHEEWWQPYDLDCFVMSSENDEGPIDYRINEVRSRIEKALMADPYRDGLAIQTEILDPDLWDEVNGAASGITVRCRVHYRTLDSDPYEL